MQQNHKTYRNHKMYRNHKKYINLKMYIPKVRKWSKSQNDRRKKNVHKSQILRKSNESNIVHKSRNVQKFPKRNGPNFWHISRKDL